MPHSEIPNKGLSSTSEVGMGFRATRLGARAVTKIANEAQAL